MDYKGIIEVAGYGALIGACIGAGLGVAQGFLSANRIMRSVAASFSEFREALPNMFETIPKQVIKIGLEKKLDNE